MTPKPNYFERLGNRPPIAGSNDRSRTHTTTKCGAAMRSIMSLNR